MLAGASVTPRLPSGVLPRLFPLPFASHPNATRSTHGTARGSSRLGHLVLRLSRASRVLARGELTLARYPPRVHPRARCWQEDRSVRGENEEMGRSTNAGKRRLDRAVRDLVVILRSMDNESKLRFRERNDVDFESLDSNRSLKRYQRYFKILPKISLLKSFCQRSMSVPSLYILPPIRSSDSSNGISFSERLYCENDQEEL